MVFDIIHSIRNYSICAGYLFIVLAPVILAYRDSLSSPIGKDENKIWHRIGYIARFPLILICPLELVLVYLFYFWIVFDGFYNLFTNENWWYVGKTAGTDKITGKWNHKIKWTGFLIVGTLTVIVI